MATNLVSEVAEVLSPTIVSRIASAFGLNQTSTQKAIVAAVPALLAAFISISGYAILTSIGTQVNSIYSKVSSVTGAAAGGS